MEKYWKNKKKMIMNYYKKKGEFVVYTKEEGKRFVIPLCYLHHPIFKILLQMAEEEYGLTVHGPLILPCDKELFEYILTLLKNKPLPLPHPNSHDDDHDVEKEKALFMFVTGRASSLSTTSFLPTMMAAAAAAAAASSGGQNHHHHHKTAMLSMSCS